MLEIESRPVRINKNTEEVFNFLKNLHNTGKLMPDQIINWKGSENKVSYTIKGMADLEMQIAELVPNSSLKIDSTKEKPFPFSLNYLLTPVESNVTEFKILFSGDVNPFMRIMVEKPLTNLFNYMAEQLPKQFN